MELKQRAVPRWVDIEYQGETLGFRLQTLTAADRVSLGQLVTERVGEAFAFAAERAVTDWRGITSEGAPCAFSKQHLATLFADASRSDLLVQLGQAITESAQ